MPARVSETFVLRTYPFREADLIVSFLTRDLGKLRGVARRARRPKSPFGSGLERLSQVRMAYFQKENAELVNLSGCELIESQFGLQSEYALSVVLDYFTEVAEQLLPAHEPNEKFFRLMAAVLAYLRGGSAIRGPPSPTSASGPCASLGLWPEARVSDETVEIVHEMFEHADHRARSARLVEEHRQRPAPRADPHHGTTRRAQIPDRSLLEAL